MTDGRGADININGLVDGEKSAINNVNNRLSANSEIAI
jgi:hypothetical protein